MLRGGGLGGGAGRADGGGAGRAGGGGACRWRRTCRWTNLWLAQPKVEAQKLHTASCLSRP